MPSVHIVLGSETDRPIAEKAKAFLDEAEVTSEIVVASAHRNPEKLDQLVKGSDASVFIAVAGLSAALPGAIASKTLKPVIGVPVNVKLEGLDALLASMQLPSGVVAGVVGIDNGRNAGLLAAEILALNDAQLARKLVELREKAKKK